MYLRAIQCSPNLSVFFLYPSFLGIFYNNRKFNITSKYRATLWSMYSCDSYPNFVQVESTSKKNLNENSPTAKAKAKRLSENLVQWSLKCTLWGHWQNSCVLSYPWRMITGSQARRATYLLWGRWINTEGITKHLIWQIYILIQ